MTTRRLILAIAIWILAATLVFVLWQYAFAQRRTVQPQHWIPLIRQEQEPATPIANMGLIYVDPNGDACYKDIDGKKSIFAGDHVTYNLTSMAIDTNVIYVDAENDTIGFFTTTPAAEAGIQYSDKFVICDTFTSAGINACIDALGSEAGEVYLPEGTYAITTSIVIDYSNTTIRGAGDGTILMLGAAVAGIKPTSTNLENIVLKDFLIDGNDIDVTYPEDLIYANGTKNFYVDNVSFQNFEDYALLATGDASEEASLIVNNCRFNDTTDTSSTAIRVAGYYQGACCNITNCIFNNLDQGIWIADGHTKISQCNFYNCADKAIYIWYSSGVTNPDNTIIDSCYFYGNYLDIDFEFPGMFLVISNNIFRASTHHSIELDYWGYVLSNNIFTEMDDITYTVYVGYNEGIIEGNYFYADADETDYFLYFDGAGSVTVCDNFFDTGVDTAAVYMDSDDTGNVFYGNQNLTFSGSGRVYGVFEVAGPIRTYESEWYVADHHDMAGMDPGASGATWTDPSAGTTLGGMQLNAAGETLTFATDCHSDWDGASDIEIKVVFEVNVDNSGGDPNDTVDIKVISYFKGSEETTLKTQTNEVATVVGQSAQYKQWVATILIDYDDGSNPIDAGDKFRHILNLETDTSEVDDIIVNHIHSRYKTKQVHVEI